MRTGGDNTFDGSGLTTQDRMLLLIVNPSVKVTNLKNK